ncbi:hypothetical protein KC19_1G277300 [Ceratodon purpureus]|uniref:PROP1-like PPR domain-containing protein n=1 Tax=Ceratodon purpureus TaxID=3225 RepID=A0A8T0JDH2_CERPU|nr:hypothetical protein KC19_1G277300 [Ceratodon purpureus]
MSSWCPCHGLSVATVAMANSCPAMLQLQSHYHSQRLGSVGPSLGLSGARSAARCSFWYRIGRGSPLFATLRDHEAGGLESSSASRAVGVRASSSIECVDRVPQGGSGSEIEALDESLANGNGSCSGNAMLQELPELDWVALDETRQLDTEEFLFTQDYLDSLDYDSFITEPQERSFAEEQVVLKLGSATIAEKTSRPKSVRINVVRTARKGARALPASIAEVLPVKPETSIKFYIGLYGALLRAGRIKDSLVLLGEMDKAGKLNQMKVNHSKFYEACKARGTVEDGFTFMKIMINNAKLQHYTMLLSLCCHARDIDGALRVLALLESRGLKADCMFYTTLISACSKAGKVDLLFQIFHEMELHDVEPSVHTFGAMIDGCARAGQLPKAFGAYGIMISKNVKPDRVIFNTLINACSRAGAVQRAFDVLTDMKSEATPVKPDHVTYGALIAACARGGEVEKALEVYESMRESNVKGSPECYTAIVHACSQKGELEYALTVYDHLKQDGVKPDEVFFSAMIDVAGHSKDIKKAFSMLDSMKKDGLKPGPVVYSSLMGVCSNLGEWEKALELYEDIRVAGLRPTVSTYNALMTALCEAEQFDQALSVLKDLKDAKMRPNQISYSILMKACEKEGKADMALELYMNARAEGIKSNQVICESITGLCLHQIQSSALAPQICSSMLPVPTDSSNVSPQDKWATWALAIYRQTIEAGALPTVETLSQLLGCLRKPEEPTKAVTSFDDRTMMAFLGQPQQAITSTGYDGFSIYDPRALSLFEEASALKIVPTFNYTTIQPIVISAETMPVYAAEVCLLTVLKGLKQRHAAGARVSGVTIKLQVEKKESFRPKGGLVSMKTANKTGQAVAALLRRLGLKAQGHESSGELRLTLLEVQKWLQPKPTPTTTMKTPFAALEKTSSPYSLLARTIADQQRAIRLGTVTPHLQALDLMTDLDMSEGLFHADDFAKMERSKGAATRAPKKSLQRSRSF